MSDIFDTLFVLNRGVNSYKLGIELNNITTALDGARYFCRCAGNDQDGPITLSVKSMYRSITTLYSCHNLDTQYIKCYFVSYTCIMLYHTYMLFCIILYCIIGYVVSYVILYHMLYCIIGYVVSYVMLYHVL